MSANPQVRVLFDNSLTGFCLRSVREDAGLTKVELADKVGSLVEFIELVESGQGILYTHQFASLCDALGTPAWKVMHQAYNMKAQLKRWGFHVFPGPCPSSEDAHICQVVLAGKFETPQVARVLVAV